MAKLKPWTSAMFTASTFSILNYDTDFFELLRNGTVKVHIADLDHLSAGKVHLADANKSVLESDGLVCVTGWKHTPALKLLPEGIDKELGLPHQVTRGDGEIDLASRSELFEKADEEILNRFPRLRNPPEFNKKYTPLLKQAAFDSDDQITPDTALSPPLLYHFIAPVSPRFLRTRDFAFAGGIMNFSAAICAHIQGLWIAAYFDGKLVRDPTAGILTSEPSQRSEPSSSSLEDIQYETILYNRFGRWRYPADHGAKFPDFVFDVVPYMDVMMADLGLQVHRKGGWFKEITDPYGPEDYVDINDEWRRKFAEK